MTKEIRFNAFAMNCTGHMAPGPEFVGIGGRGPVIFGLPATIADQLQRWIDETDVDGFNLAYVVMPETYQNIVDLLVPELQRCGVYKRNIDMVHCGKNFFS